MTSSKPWGLYIHVPFCRAKCPYCDFYSGRELGALPEYVRAVKEELRTLRRVRAFADGSLFSRPLASVYFGGGSPSLLPAGALAELLQTVKEAYRLQPGAEITVEVNPTLSEKDAWFAGAAAAGVNRVSVGMQSALDAERKALGRRGTADDVLKTVAAAKNAGISDLSVDIMLGLPGQTEETLAKSLDFALSLGVNHLSAYLLKIEPGTVFDRKKDDLNLPDEDAAADLYLFMCEYLKARGLRHYEISNFCSENRVGRHNLAYWRGGEYLGVGPAAHSFVNGRRFYFPRDLAAFLAGGAPADDGPGGDADETLMLALRTDEGLFLPGYVSRFGLSPGKGFYREISALQKAGLACMDENVLRLTDRGFLVSNSIIAALLAAL